PSSQMQKVDKVDTKILTSTSVLAESNEYFDNKNTKKLSKELKISREQSASIYKILAECGVKDIEYIEKMDGNDVRGYFVHISNANNPVRLGLFANNKVDMVIYDAWVLYEDGKLKDNLNNYAIPAQDLLSLKVTSMQEIRKYLTYPQSAKFNDDWSTTKDGNGFILSSKVKYKTDFGQELKAPFTVQFTKNKNGFKAVFVSIDNAVMLKEDAPQKQLSEKDKQEVKELERLMGS
ncbi:MAG: hypothetical protein WCG95_08925, partial [bacterium]